MSITSDASTEVDNTSEMDVDGMLSSFANEPKPRAGVIFAQSEELNVSLQAHLPIEVLKVLRNAGQYSSSLVNSRL